MQDAKKILKEKVSVCIPVYNGADTILETINSILNQTFADFELLIVDNFSTDDTVSKVKTIKDDRIKIIVNEKNVGCGGNLNVCKQYAIGEIIYFISADDIADINALKRMYDAFKQSANIGIVTRSYYWFVESVSKAVRVKKQFESDIIVSINNAFEDVRDVIALSDQISGIAFRKKFMQDFSFLNQAFVEMASMVVQVLKISDAVILSDNTVAVRIDRNGSMNPAIYIKSPMMVWYDLIVKSFNEEKFIPLRKYLIANFIANNYIGLVQIRSFGGIRYALREIYYLVKLKWSNLFNLGFWFFSLGVIIVPSGLLQKIVAYYKNRVNIKFLQNIKVNLGA
ncbi:MAG: glycosyltransferase family 2 protein [Candidatus Omnitrophica bacterium]|nr:glycosyltransferase family 2 protein [Candidatus Omnitrophota bacterium]